MVQQNKVQDSLGAWRQPFLAAFAASGNISEACKVAGISRPAVYNARERDAAFAEAWDEAREEAADLLEAEAMRRVRGGVDEPVSYQEKQCAMVRRYSDTLLIFLLKSLRPEKYAAST